MTTPKTKAMEKLDEICGTSYGNSEREALIDSLAAIVREMIGALEGYGNEAMYGQHGRAARETLDSVYRKLGELG
jgi:hypothetical protein